MMTRIKSIGAVTFLALAATATMSLAQDWPPELTGYHYVWYHDEAKTQYGGEVSDVGCGGFGISTYVQRAYVPSGYYDTTPIFYCGGQPGPIE